MDHPFDKPETRAAISIVIRNSLYEKLPDRCIGYPDNYRSLIYSYVSNRYGYAV